LLLEPQRTNIFKDGEYVASTLGVSNGGITYNDVTSPEGLTNGHKFYENTSTSLHFARLGSVGVDTYTFSAYMKAAGRSKVLVTADYNNGAVFNLSTGAVDFYIGSGYAASVEDAGNGWYRCIAIFTTTASATFYLSLLNDNNDTSYAGDGTSGVHIYGVQCEAGSYATSYIPTYGSAVTRNGDSLTNAGTLEMFDNNEGTLYVEFSALANDGRDNSFRWLISDGTNNDRIQIGLLQNDLLYGSVVVNNVGTSGVDYSLPNPASNHKIAVTYTQTKFDLWVDGVKVDTDTNTTIPSGMYRYDFFRIANNNDFVEGNIKQTMYFPIALNDQDMINLTTL
jgi:hypothetical protein